MVEGTFLYDFACVFWDYGLGDWNTDGCSKGNSSGGLLRCSCNHTTNFAALWVNIKSAAEHENQVLWGKKTQNVILLLLQMFRQNVDYAEALNGISIAGLSLSILGLVVSIVYHIREK